MLVHVETLLLLSHPWSRVATGRDAGGGDGVPCGNSSGSAGKEVSSLWVGGRDVSRGCAGQTGVCLGRRRKACCLGVASCCCRCLGDNRGLYLPFSLPPRCLDGWHHLVCGAVWCCGLRPAVPTCLALKMQPGHKPWPCCQCPRCPITPGHTVTVFAAFSALSAALARALWLLWLTPLPSHHGRFVLPWGCG